MTPWAAAHQASLSFTISQSLLKLKVHRVRDAIHQANHFSILALRTLWIGLKLLGGVYSQWVLRQTRQTHTLLKVNKNVNFGTLFWGEGDHQLLSQSQKRCKTEKQPKRAVKPWVWRKREESSDLPDHLWSKGLRHCLLSQGFTAHS